MVKCFDNILTLLCKVHFYNWKTLTEFELTQYCCCQSNVH